MAKRDLWARWSRREDDIEFNWTGHDYDEENNVLREGGTKRDGGVLYGFFDLVKIDGKSLVEELKARGYDITTLKFSISKKETKKP